MIPTHPRTFGVARNRTTNNNILVRTWRSNRKHADGRLDSKEALTVVLDAAMDNDVPLVRFLTPRAQNWATWEAAVIRYAEENGKRVVLFKQKTAYEMPK